MESASLEPRVEAIELFLQQLVFLLEVEPNLNRQTISNWLLTCREAMRSHDVIAAPTSAAFGNLIDRTLELTSDPQEPNVAAKQAAASGLRKAQKKSPPPAP